MNGAADSVDNFAGVAIMPNDLCELRGTVLVTARQAWLTAETDDAAIRGGRGKVRVLISNEAMKALSLLIDQF